jgi:hypothetical protein
MISRSRGACGITLVMLAIGLLGSVAACRSASREQGAKDSTATRPAGKVIFEFGQEDKSDQEFCRRGLKEINEYRCRVGVDCSTEAFPAYLLRAGDNIYAREYAYGGVERVVISYRLKRNYNDVILRLARGGDETTVVKVDGLKTHLVTSKMLGSSEGFGVGVCNLSLGALEKGEHTVELTVADDDAGNAVYQWDALSLIAR